MEEPTEASGVSAGAWGESALRKCRPARVVTHLEAPLAGERRRERRSGNAPVWILSLFHTFSPIKSRSRHMIIKKKTSSASPNQRGGHGRLRFRAAPTSGAGSHRPGPAL